MMDGGMVRAMRCMACGAEMRLMQVVRDATLLASGYERHTLQCAGCGEIERHLEFCRQNVLDEPVPIAAMRPSLMPPASGAWARAVARLRGRPIG